MFDIFCFKLCFVVITLFSQRVYGVSEDDFGFRQVAEGTHETMKVLNESSAHDGKSMHPTRNLREEARPTPLQTIKKPSTKTTKRPQSSTSGPFSLFLKNSCWSFKKSPKNHPNEASSKRPQTATRFFSIPKTEIHPALSSAVPRSPRGALRLLRPSLQRRAAAALWLCAGKEPAEWRGAPWGGGLGISLRGV